MAIEEFAKKEIEERILNNYGIKKKTVGIQNG